MSDFFSLACLALLCASNTGSATEFDHSTCEKNITFDLRDWVVDYLRPTISLGGKAIRKPPFKIDPSKKKAALLVNNSYPGPLVEATEGQLVCITVVNHFLESGVTIHWHGLHLNGYPSMDGVYGVTQAGISPQGGSFTYRFKPNAGTHFYHAHMQAQQMDRGLKGPIVIHAKDDPHRKLYDAERIVVLSDERQDPSACMRSEGAEPGNPVCNEIDKASFNGQWGDGSEEYPWPLTTITQGGCYRLRFIGMMGQSQNFQVQIAGHNMTLIAVDGVDVEPEQLSQFNLHAGERVDVVVCADQEPGNYLMTATYDGACFLESAPSRNQPKVDSCNFWAFLNYAGHTEKPGRATKKKGGGYNPPKGTGGGALPHAVAGPKWDTHFQSNWTLVKNLQPTSEPEEADVSYVINLGLSGPDYDRNNPDSPYGTTDRLYMFTHNNPWKKPATPLLQTKGNCGADGVPVLTIKNGTTVEVVINNISPTPHVLHMHGASFSVINYAPFTESWCSDWTCFLIPREVAKMSMCPNATAGDPSLHFPLFWGCPYDALRDSKSQNLKSPLRRDTMGIPQRSWAVIRFRADNPGAWIFHCHMEQHIPTGQVMVFNIKPDEQPPIPKDVPTEGPCPVWTEKPMRRGPLVDVVV